MEEKIIIQSKQYNFNKVRKTLLSISYGIILFALIYHFIELVRDWGDKPYRYINMWHKMTNRVPFPVHAGTFMYLGIIVLIPSLIIIWWLGSYTLTVTDKRIYGKTAFGKRVDLPVDSVSAVATSMFNSIAIATSSGRIVFGLIKNRDEIHAEITKLIVSRQQAKNPASSGTADELKKYKELLDAGIITQEEFDTKKKQLLEI